MSAISIVIPAYNVERYLPACLDSVARQTLKDIQIIVVDDASTDGTPAIIAAAAAKDDRITVITHKTNQGLHLARRSGVEAATGEWTLFLDGDDELAPDMCENLYRRVSENPVDILHFGITVIGENGLPDSERESFESYINNPDEPATTGLATLRAIYSEAEGQKVDWRTTQRLYRTALVRKAFAAMTDKRLERAEDGYETFVLSAFAGSAAAAKDCKGLLYHYGTGVTGATPITAERYGQFCEQFKACLDATESFVAGQTGQSGQADQSAQPAEADKESANDAESTGQPADLTDCLIGMKHKALELLSNDWLNRVPEDGKREAADRMAAVLGPAVTAREIYRFVRDRAYPYIINKESIVSEQDPLFDWQRIADDLNIAADSESNLERMQDTRKDAVFYVNELRNRLSDETMAIWNAQPIRIFVTTHKPVDMPKSTILQPVQVGGGLKDPNTRFRTAFHDDDGENISAKNPMYCELTTQYWAWKNIDAEYYGFCHYRRYFDFSPIEHEENPYGEIMDDYIDDAAAKKYGLDDATMTKAIEGWDIITTGIKDLREVIDKRGTPKKLYQAAPKLHLKDLRHVYDIVCARHPDYKEDADAFLDGNFSCFCNMYIMRKKYFQAYCEWMFPILEEFERTTDMSTYSKEALRTPGHLSERLFNIWFMHLKRTNPELKTKETQCVHFTDPEPAVAQRPLDPAVVKGRPIVPVVFAADNNYVGQLTTTIYSAMKNASPDHFYDVTVMEKDIAGERQETMRRFFAERFGNMNLRFADVKRDIAGYDLTTSNAHISIETYYRFLIQKALPFYGKVLYLDSDIVILGDIAKLYATELGSNLLAAVHDVDYLGNLNINDGIRMKYTRETLGMKNPYGYFQAGVLVLNTAAMRRAYTIAQWLEYASEPSYIYNDQDVLNVHCEGRVKYLPWNWNVMHDCGGRVGNVFSFAPNDAFDAYLASRQNPQIIHYAGFEKPWTNPGCDFADVYWSYARETPFYEMLQQRVAQAAADAAAARAVEEARRMAAEVAAAVAKPKHQPAMGDNNPLRKVIDPIAPLGSRRREAMKAVGRALRGRK